MIIPGELTQAYNRIYYDLDALKHKCDPLLEKIARSVKGRAESRIKSIESLLLKIEKDCPSNPFTDIHDLYAATIIIQNVTLSARVEEQISDYFDIIEKIPPITKKPEEFRYNDLHYVLKLKKEISDSDSSIYNFKFELQIKTELQAAVSKISHQLSYKPPRLSWYRSRLESRMRALAETIDELLGNLAKVEENNDNTIEDYQEYVELNNILDVVANIFDKGEIPEDKRRLAHTINSYLKQCKPPLSYVEFKKLLLESNYEIPLQASYLTIPQKVFIILVLDKKLQPKNLNTKRKYYVTQDMIALCPDLKNISEDLIVNFELDNIKLD